MVTVYDDFAHHPTAIRTTVDGLRRQLDREGRQNQRILAIFEPRSNTMKLRHHEGAAALEPGEGADLAFCHSGRPGLGCAAALAPMGERARVAGDIDQPDPDGVMARAAGRPAAVHEQRRLLAASTASVHSSCTTCE